MAVKCFYLHRGCLRQMGECLYLSYPTFELLLSSVLTKILEFRVDILSATQTIGPTASRQLSATLRAARKRESVCRRLCGLAFNPPTVVG